MLAPIRPRPTMPSWTPGGASEGAGGGRGAGNPSDMRTGCHAPGDGTVGNVANDVPTELPSDLRRELDGAVAAHRALVDALDGLDDATARRPSLLPGWSVGHVLAHLARNAEGMTGMLAAAARGDVAAQYPGGAAQREGDIGAGAGR